MEGKRWLLGMAASGCSSVGEDVVVPGSLRNLHVAAEDFLELGSGLGRRNNSSRRGIIGVVLDAAFDKLVDGLLNDWKRN
jgi:hypothetical protein